MKTMSKKERVTALVAGTVMFVMAVLFAVAIIFKLFDFGNPDISDGNILRRLGRLLYDAYGFSSLLIPVFFLAAGSFCFDSKWSVQRALSLLISPLPFFTVVFAESWAKNIHATNYGPVAIIKIVVLLLFTILLIVAEYLVTLVIAGAVQKKLDAVQEAGARRADALKRHEARVSAQTDEETLADDSAFAEPEVNESFFEPSPDESEKTVVDESYDYEEDFDSKPSISKTFLGFLQKNRRKLEKVLKASPEKTELHVPDAKKEIVDINDFYTAPDDYNVQVQDVEVDPDATLTYEEAVGEEFSDGQVEEPEEIGEIPEQFEAEEDDGRPVLDQAKEAEKAALFNNGGSKEGPQVVYWGTTKHRPVRKEEPEVNPEVSEPAMVEETGVPDGQEVPVEVSGDLAEDEAVEAAGDLAGDVTVEADVDFAEEVPVEAAGDFAEDETVESSESVEVLETVSEESSPVKAVDAVAETESAPGPEVSEEVSSGEEQEAVTKLSEPVVHKPDSRRRR